MSRQLTFRRTPLALLITGLITGLIAVLVAGASLVAGRHSAAHRPVEVLGTAVVADPASIAAQTSVAPPASVAAQTSVAAPASIASDCTQPAGPALGAWLATLPAGTTAQLAHGGCYALDTGVILNRANRLTIDGNGAQLKAVTRAIGTGRPLLDIRGGHDVTIKNLSLRGVLTFMGPYTTGFHSPDEWQHGIYFHGTQNPVVANVTVQQVLGDFVEAGADTSTSPWTPTRNLRVIGSTFDGAGRQGFGLTDLDGGKIRGNHISHVNLNALDLEPNTAAEFARNVTVADNTFGALRYSAVANVGQGAAGHVGGIAVLRNVSTVMPTTCQPYFYENAPRGIQRTGYRIENNTILSITGTADISGADDITIISNTVTATSGIGGCGHGYAVGLNNVHRATVQNNVFRNVSAVLRPTGVSAAVTITGNRVGPQPFSR